jgi:hypothetical protein
MNLNEYLGSKPMTTLNVARIEQDLTSDGEKIAVLYLAEPIPTVQGSQSVADEDGKQKRIESYDVDVVRIHQKLFNEIVLPEDWTGSGLITTNLRLDVAKRSGDVMLTDESFASFGRKGNQERAREIDAGILKRMEDRKVKATFKDGTKETPEPVATPKAEPKTAKAK